jgi:hypothetical protein
LFPAVFKSAGNFPTEFSAENEKKNRSKHSCDNPQVIRQGISQENPQEICFRSKIRRNFRRKQFSAGNSTDFFFFSEFG